MTGRVDFRVLGPLEAVGEDGVVPLAKGKQRAVLGVLLMHANEVVATDRLIEDVWGAHPPATATKSIHVYVSQLRRSLGANTILTRPPGYALTVEAGQVDLHRFERLREEAARADPASAAAKLHEALALWRGAPFADFTYDAFAQTTIARLEELRLSALEERIEADLKLGRHAELVAELATLAQEHPLREQLRGAQMLALYRCERQAEALAAYQEARRALVDELGIEPGRGLHELERSILVHDASLDFVPAPANATGETPAIPADDPVRWEPLPHRERPRETVTLPGAERGLDESRPAPDVRKTVTVVSVAITTSSARAEGLDPETLRRVERRTFAGVKSAIERHGGTIEMVSGDAITAVFGLPFVHEDDAVRGMRAAMGARATLLALAAQLAAETSLQLECRTGVSTGEVIAGGEGLPQPRATGMPLTRSLRLVHAAGPGEIIVDEATHRLARYAIGAERVDGAWRLLELTESDARVERRLVSPMIGRTRERRRMQDAFEQAVSDSSCQLFTVLGLAGVGKSRLVHEFLCDLAGPARVARGRCLPYGEGITFWPLLEIIREAVGDAGGTSPAEVMARQVITGLAEGSGGAEEGFAAVQALFEALARTEPLVLVLDDIHWGEATFLDLVEHIADWTREAPILLICLARPDLLEVRPGWGGGKLNATSVLLEPLTDAECSLLIKSLVGRAELAGEVETRIAEAAEGNPLFVEEMLSMLVDDGVLVHADGRWATTRDLASVPVPPTIQALLGARLDRLTAGERGVIERAAVEGKVFHQGSIAALASESLRPSIGAHLGTLVRRDLIRPDQAQFATERAFRFRHLLIRDAAYDSIPKAIRAELHELFARWLEERTGDPMSGYEEIIGYHLEQAYLYHSEVGPVDEAARALAREAAGYLGSAGQRAFIRGDAAAAVNLISRAVPLLPPDDPSRIDLVPNVRVVQGLTGNLSWAHRVLTEAATAAAVADDTRLEAHALVQHAFLRLFTEPDITPDELLSVAADAISVFEECSDQLGLARAWRLTAQAHYLARRGRASAEASEHALEHAHRVGDALELREIVEWLCVALMLGPTPAREAAARCEKLLAEIEREPILEPTVLSVLANAEAMQGHEERARELLARWRTAVDELGDSIWLSAINFGFVTLADDPVASERELRPGYEALRRIGEKSHFSSVTGSLARAVCAQGRYEEAEQLSRESEQAARPNDIHSHILWRTTRARVLAQRGELEAAEGLAREAVAFAAESDFLDSHGDALTDLAEILVVAERRDEAASALRQAVGLYELKGNIISAVRARDRLEQLA
jgi:DNA-binding SARP family transcriptional activator/class 3 adenylate cyclase/tetratricopeptide (TPR) repeat protein